MYQTTIRNGAPSTAALLGSVLGISATGCLITALGAHLFADVPRMIAMIAIFVALGLLMITNAIRDNNLALVSFYAFTFVEGIAIAPLVNTYVVRGQSQVVADAAVTTGMGMLLLAAIAYTTSFDFRRLSGVAFGLLMALVVVGILSLFLHFIHPQVYAWMTLGIFALITLVDFARLRAGGDGMTPVQMAIQIYLDALNIFVALLQIFGNRNRD